MKQHGGNQKTAFAIMIAAAAVAACLAGPAAEAQAADDTTATQFELYAPQTGESRILSSGSGISTQSIGPYGNTYCDTAASDFQLKSYSATAAPGYTVGSVSLQCGNSANGFIHIRDRHAAEWLGQYAKYGPTTGLDWSDVADFDMKTALSAPLATSEDAVAQKTCYAGLIQIKEVPSGDVLGHYEPTVYVSQNNKKIVTAIPTSRERCSGIFG
ncbi:hypothetical protein ACIPJ2_13355 [Curtobacterium sp. NPDC090217]|uniref:hypothetical protein n=1 Tax=Curtobacterium sp. NPDC090217 TaxID=3363970 RepID=UPI00382F6AAA